MMRVGSRELKKNEKTSLGVLFPTFLVLAILILSIFTLVISSRKPVNVESEAFVQGLLTPPTNAEIITINDNLNKEVDLKLTWEDNADNEVGYALYWYIDDYTTGLKKIETPNVTEAEFCSLPCMETQMSYYIYILLSAYSVDNTSIPATTELTAVVPSCSEFIEELPANPYADINRDKRVDVLDYSILYEYYGLVVTKNLMCEIVE